MGIGDERLLVGARAAVFLDRDGVITEPVLDGRLGSWESPYGPHDVALVAGAAEAICELRAAGFLVIGASNQPSAAKGQVSLDDLRAVHERAVSLLSSAATRLDDWRYCLHHPDGIAAGEPASCDCRKPAPGLLLGAARDHDIDLARSWMIGDSDSDVLAGKAAGTQTILVEHPRTAHRRLGVVQPTIRAPDLRFAARRLCEYHARSGDAQRDRGGERAGAIEDGRHV